MANAANAIDEEWVVKKLTGANSSQDSVQGLSLWALNHKTQHEKIVSIWFKVMKSAKLDLRLTLFYLCNEVVQTCKRKHAIVFKDAFKEVLKDAALLVRDNSIRSNIERIFRIWGERHVYNKEFVDELMAILKNTKVKSSLNTRLLAEFKTAKLMKLIKDVADEEEEVELKRLQLSDQGWHSIDVEIFKQQLKDRSECGQYVDQVNGCRQELQQYVNDLENEMRDRLALVQMLEQSALYYDTQNGEASIVATAYRNFGGRVNTLNAKLKERHKVTTSESNALSSYSSASAHGRSSDATTMSDQDVTPTEDEFDDDSFVGDSGAVGLRYNLDVGADTTEDDDDNKRETKRERRNSKRELLSPEYSIDSSVEDFVAVGNEHLWSMGYVEDVVSEHSSPLWPNVMIAQPSSSSSFLPAVTSHSNARVAENPIEVSRVVRRPYGTGTVPASATPTRDEEPGGATPVQDEEPNDDLPGDLVKQAILNSNKTSLLHRVPIDGTNHPMHTYALETGCGGGGGEASPTTPASGPSWTTNDNRCFAPSDCHPSDPTGAAVYETYDENYELVYPYEIYGAADGTAETAYVVEVLRPDGVMEVYPSSEADFQGVYHPNQVVSVIDETGEVYPVATGGDAYQSQQMMTSGAYYGEFGYPHPPDRQASLAVSDAAAGPRHHQQHQQPVVYHTVQGFAPLPFGQPSLASFSHPPPQQPDINRAPLSFIHHHHPPPPSSLNQPPPPLFAMQQNSALPPPPPPAAHPPIPTIFLARPVSHSAYGLSSPTISVNTPTLASEPSSLENASSVVVTNSPYRRMSSSTTGVWNRSVVSSINDRVVGGRGTRDFASSSSSDPLRPSRFLPPRNRRTNLTYLTQVPTTEDDNGNGAPTDDVNDRSRYPSAALRSTSLPCYEDARTSINSFHRRTESQSSTSPSDHGDGAVLQKSASFETLSDGATPADGNVSELGDGGGNIAEDDGYDEMTIGKTEDQERRTNRFASNSIPSLGSRGRTARFTNNNCRPPQRSDFHAVSPLVGSVLRPRSPAVGHFQTRPYFPVARLPFHRDFRDNY